MSLGPLSRIDILRDRAKALAQARAFFEMRGILEVDTPHLATSVIVDSYIDLMPVAFLGEKTCYLNSSPEMYMKQLLSEGMGDIYQLGHVFRDGELGRKHQPEFTMCEWYRIGFTYEDMIQESVDFIQTLLGIYPIRKMPYRQAFLEYANLDPCNWSLDELRLALLSHGFEPLQTEEIDELAHQIMAEIIEPHFKVPEYIVLTHFPPSMASLAKVTIHEGCPAAERFEIYFQGLELANGFNELSDSSEQFGRFQSENQKRLAANKPELPIALDFIDSLKRLPPCCGVAVGFDRVLMLKAQARSLLEVLPFAFQEN